MAKKSEVALPVYKQRIGLLQMAVWENEREVDGESKVFRTVSLKRSYKDNDGNWQETAQLNVEDLGNAIKLLDGALNYCMRD